MRLTTRRTAAGLALLMSAALSGCGLATAGGYVPDNTLAGPLADAEPLDGASIAVGSKNFTENILLGKIALILLQADGAEVEDLTNIPGSASARQAHLEGEIDAMWEYTGTGWLVYLGEEEAIPDEQGQYDAVAQADLEQNDLVWLPPAPMNNTYSFAITQETAEKYGITTMSQMAQVPVEERTYCVESEFENRSDGLPGVLETYGIPRGDPNGVPNSNIQLYQTGAIYEATAQGRCTFGEVFTTDGRILALDLTVLEDDKAYFPKYNVSLVVRKEVMDEYPQIEELMAPVTEKLTNEVLLDLNAQIDVDGREPTDVAQEWLREEGFIE
jgi:osmoprotectant transport system substrate-binding protein